MPGRAESWFVLIAIGSLTRRSSCHAVYLRNGFACALCEYFGGGADAKLGARAATWPAQIRFLANVDRDGQPSPVLVDQAINVKY